MVHMIMEMVGNHGFTLTDGKRSRLRCLKNGSPTGISPGALSFQHIYNLNAYADDLAVMHADRVCGRGTEHGHEGHGNYR